MASSQATDPAAELFLENEFDGMYVYSSLPKLFYF